MKLILITLFVVVSLGLLCLAQNPHTSPGMRHAQELESQNERGFPPQTASRPALKVAELQGEAGQLADNLNALIADLMKAKPATSKGQYLQKVALSSTMGVGVPVDTSTLAAASAK